MNVLVTGGRGFIGRKLIKKLLKEGHYVISLDRSEEKGTKILGPQYLSIDLMLINNISMPSIDVVYHLAAVGVDKVSSFEDPSDVFRNNLEVTNEVIKWCIKNDAKLIYAGSASKFFNVLQSPYTLYKSMAEDSIRLFQKHYNLKADIATIYNVYGYCTETETEISGLIGAWKQQIKKGTLKVYGNGDQVKDFIHVDDVTDALCMLLYSEPSTENWHIGSDDVYSVNNIFDLFKLNNPKLKKKVTLSSEVDNSDQKLVNIKFHKTFKWTPKHFLSNYIKNVFKYAD